MNSQTEPDQSLFAPDQSLFYTLREAARKLRISRRTATRRLKAGEIPFVRLGNKKLVPRAALEAIATAATAETRA